MDGKLLISAMLALVSLVAIGGGVWNRNKVSKGIGWQFIRFTTIVVALPLAGILALNDLLSEGATAIIAGALGYAFGKGSGEDA